MIYQIVYIIIFSTLFTQENNIIIDEIITAMDKNLNAKSRILKSKMIIHGRRSSRTIESKNWIMGTNKAFTEYLSPAREAGTKMLKIDNKLFN